ncbi:C-terminal novel E3 ligase, LRR-interacting [Bradyrhizobium brasilense]|uniref:C-terminal novel E3 ligase, LRR-interacting n=1 Tax=Bradyrhizobium brasilense TaxID=1419277 RepID=A0A1G7F0L9_9BRAD|nr:NEL-type E3 ubiquitin ligase domain-containing protein [Bradyrhizobium brasilense]SDE69422.1 C-terminal novel E3 ligase, LRR-interacting [Bradyrhizobium brasilense]
MDSFQERQIQRGSASLSASSGQTDRENEASAQWDGVVSGYAESPADSAHANGEIDQTLENWAAEQHVGPLEDREEALRRVNARDEVARLDLESLSLTSLPRLPTEIVVLEVPFNRLTSLPDGLPASLQRLDIRGNQLTSLSALPAELRGLDASSNRLRSLPEVLPTALQFLDVSHNQLPSLPETLPASLQFLYASHNRLTGLPEDLPATLQFLDVCQNRLTALPESLPAMLRFLDVSENQLASLPEDLLTQLGAGARIELGENPLPEQVLTNLDTTLRAEGYTGPTVYLSRDDESDLSGTDDGQADDLAETVAAWLRSDPKQGDREVLATWQSFAEEPGAQEYAFFLEKLFDSVNSGNEQFQQSVADDLRLAATNPQLRAQYFQLALDANQSCEDRRTLTWNGMQTARLIADVENGAYDDTARLPDLVDLGRIMFRLDALERIAREKTHSLQSAYNVEDIDAVEVYLAYQNKLRDRLGLQHVAPAMRYFEVSGVTDADVDSAETSVLTKEAAEFAGYLATDWQPWDGLVRRIAPEEYAMMQGQLIDAMGEEFDNRLEQQLADKGLAGSASDLVEDAKRELGAEIRKEIAREIKGALRDKVLNDHGVKL